MKIRKKIILFGFILSLIHLSTNAQEVKVAILSPIQTDRPDQTESPSIVPQNFFQIEAGTWTERLLPIGTKGKLFSTTVPTILTKYGVNKNFELRLITEFNNTHTGNISHQKGIPPITIGIKTKLMEEKGWRPQASIISHLGLNLLGSESLQTKSPIPSYRFLFSHTLSNKLNFSYNLGQEWSGNDEVATFIYTVSTAYAFSNKLGAFIEAYGFAPSWSKQDNRFDAGLTYLINNNQQLDVSSGFGLSANSPAYFVSAGYSFRFKR